MTGTGAAAVAEPEVRRAARVTVMGPQSPDVTLGEVLESFELPDGPVAAVTAGWQERESEDQELRALVPRPTHNLELHQRAEQAFLQDPEFAEAHRAFQRRLREQRRLYNVRLAAAMDAALQLLSDRHASTLLEAHQRGAIDTLRDLDRVHLETVAELRAEFLDHWRVDQRLAFARQHEEIRRLLDGAELLLIAGGHVAVLINRLRMFHIGELCRDMRIVCWSAGAMALTDRAVLFHDSPPWGPGNAEVFDLGLGLLPGVVMLPHGRRRLRLDDPLRVARFARRFVPDRCVVLSSGARVDWRDGSWSAADGIPLLGVDGVVEEIKAWE